MNKQQIFDTVAKHLLTQNCKAIVGLSTCAYRSDNGKKCAAGVLIKDEFYNPNMEGRNINRTETIDALSKSLGRTLEISDINLIHDLQKIHDFNHVCDWKDCLAVVGIQYALDISTLVDAVPQ